MLRIWWRNCALCVIGNEFPCRQPHNTSAPSYEGYPLCTKDKNRSPFHGEKPLMIKYFLEGGCIKSNDFAWYGRDTSHPRQMVDIQYDITIMGRREVSRPYRVLFFVEGERFLSFWRCHRPRWRGRRQGGGVADSSLCLPCRSTNDRCEALASPKGCFLCFCCSPPVFIH